MTAPTARRRPHGAKIVLLVLALVGGLTTVGSLNAAPAHASLGIQTIQHVIVIMQENRSFDEYFGTYPGAAGIPMTNGQPTTCVNDPLTHNCVYPYHSSFDYQGGGPHGAANEVADQNGNWIQQAEKYTWNQSCPNVPPTGTCTDVMGYHDNREIPNYWKYAQNYVLNDHMYESTTDWSNPSHLFTVSGWAAKCSNGLDPATCKASNNPDGSDNGAMKAGDCDDVNNPTPCTTPNYGWTDITYLLHKANVSWKQYANPSAPEWWRPLNDFVTVQQDGQGGNLQDLNGPNGYFADAKAGTLPAVSWVIPGGAESEHPPAVSSKGEEYVTSVINAAMQSPNWSSTAIFLAWDDWGGFYDHLVPPSVDKAGYGLRVPSLVISPWVKHNTVDHQTLSFDAYLKFIEDDFLNGQRLNPGPKPTNGQSCQTPPCDGRWDPRPTVRENVPILGDLSSDFDFTQTPPPPLLLPEVQSSKSQLSKNGDTTVLSTPKGKGFFAPGETVNFIVDCSWAQCTGGTNVGSAVVALDGSFSGVATVPAGIPPGPALSPNSHIIGVVGSTGDYGKTTVQII